MTIHQKVLRFLDLTISQYFKVYKLFKNYTMGSLILLQTLNNQELMYLLKKDKNLPDLLMYPCVRSIHTVL